MRKYNTLSCLERGREISPDELQNRAGSFRGTMTGLEKAQERLIGILFTRKTADILLPLPIVHKNEGSA